MSKRKRLIILIVSLVTIALVTALLLFWPGGDGDKGKTADAAPQPKLKAEFLSIDPAWADSIVSRMSTDQKLATIMVYRVQEGSNKEQISLADSLGLSGVFFQDAVFDLMAFQDTMLTTDTLQKLVGLSPISLLSNYRDSVRRKLFFNQSNTQEFLTYFESVRQFYGVNYVRLMTPDVSITDTLSFPEAERTLKEYTRERLVSLMDTLLKDSCLVELDGPTWVKDTALADSMVPFAKAVANRGLTMYNMEKNKGHITRTLETADFKGLIVVDLTDSTDTPANYLAKGADLLIVDNPQEAFESLKTLLKKDKIKENELDRKVKRVLMARKWTKPPSGGAITKRGQRFHELTTQHWQSKFLRGGIAVVRNKDRVLPLKELPKDLMVVRVGERANALVSGLDHYTNVQSQSIPNPQRYGTLNWDNLAKKNPLILALNNVHVSLEKDSGFLAKLQDLDKRTNLIVVNNGPESNLTALNEFETIVQASRADAYEQNLIGQLICGGIAASGKLSASVAGSLSFGTGVPTKKTRLAYSKPIEVGLDKDTLNQIDWIAVEGIRNRAYPGCQVLAVKDGEVIYNKSFGFQTYKRQVPIDHDQLYDMASVTKVTATTLAAMKMYDLGKFELHDSLYKYLPDSLKHYIFRGRSTLRDITWFEMLIHKSGLPPGLPYIKYVQYQTDSIGRFDRYYCDMRDDSIYCMPIAENFYMERYVEDSLWFTMNQMWLRDDKNYKYSDVNFVILYKLIRGMLEMDPSLVKMDPNEDETQYNAFDRYLQEQFYRPLGMKNTCYLPLRYFDKDRIAPTEDDKWWRMQLVHGHVHDPTAALFGGICGNAGLFSTAEEMAILFQMYLNRGYYGGTRFIQESTVNMFIQRQPGSHRGLGFNKPVGSGMYGIPEEVPIQTFGHTGFTGNSIWADPTNDIIYIFLSNRSHPDAHNPKIINLGTRKRIHRAIYRSMVNEEWLEEVKSTLPDA